MQDRLALASLLALALTTAATAIGCDEDFDDCLDALCLRGPGGTTGGGASGAAAGGSSGAALGGGAGQALGGGGNAPGGGAATGGAGAHAACSWKEPATLEKSLVGAAEGVTGFVGELRVERHGAAPRILASPGGALAVFAAGEPPIVTDEPARILWTERTADGISALVEGAGRLVFYRVPDTALSASALSRADVTATPLGPGERWSHGRFVRDGGGGAFVAAVRESDSHASLVSFHWSGESVDPTPVVTTATAAAIAPTGLARVDATTHLFSRLEGQRVTPDGEQATLRPAPPGGTVWAAPSGGGLAVTWVDASGGLHAGAIEPALAATFDPLALPALAGSLPLADAPFDTVDLELEGDVGAAFGVLVASPESLRGLVVHAGTVLAAPPRPAKVGKTVGRAAWTVLDVGPPLRLAVAWTEVLASGIEVLLSSELTCAPP